MKTQKLTLVHKPADREGFSTTDFLVDGKSLARLTAHANANAPEVSVGLNNQWLTEYQVQYLERLLGEANPDMPDGRVGIFVCPIDGDLLCDTVACRIEFTDKHVKWHDFVWDISSVDEDGDVDELATPAKGLGSYTFDRDQYELVLRSELDGIKAKLEQELKTNVPVRIWRDLRKGGASSLGALLFFLKWAAILGVIYWVGFEVITPKFNAVVDEVSNKWFGQYSDAVVITGAIALIVAMLIWGFLLDRKNAQDPAIARYMPRWVLRLVGRPKQKKPDQRSVRTIGNVNTRFTTPAGEALWMTLDKLQKSGYKFDRSSSADAEAFVRTAETYKIEVTLNSQKWIGVQFEYYDQDGKIALMYWNDTDLYKIDEKEQWEFAHEIEDDIIAFLKALFSNQLLVGEVNRRPAMVFPGSDGTYISVIKKRFGATQDNHDSLNEVTKQGNFAQLNP